MENSRKNEYAAVSRLAKADRHYRVVLYILTFLGFVVFLYGAYELHLTRQNIQADNKRLIAYFEDKINKSLRSVIIQNEETRAYITCLLSVPIEQRSQELQLNCFNQIDQPGGLDPADFRPSVFGLGSSSRGGAGSNQENSRGAVVYSYPNNTPIQSAPPSNNLQPPATSVDPPKQPDAPKPPDPPTSVLQPTVNALEGVLNSVTGLIGLKL